MSRARRALALLLLAPALGCASRPPLAVQRFALAMPSGPLPAPAPGARVVALPPVRMSALNLEPALVYRVDGDRVEVDPYAALAAPPRSLVTEALGAWLRREPNVLDVVSPLAGPSALAVEVEVEEMTGDFRVPASPAALLCLRVSVHPGSAPAGASPLLRKLYARREPLERRTAPGVVAGWNRALAAIAKELGQDLGALP